jgi:FAD/FMN-containing dehydrogenase
LDVGCWRISFQLRETGQHPKSNIQNPFNMLIEDASGFRGQADEIVAPDDEAGVISFLRRASETATPVTIAGAGTGVTGGGVPLSGALLSLGKLKRLEIRRGWAIAGPGVLLADLHAAAAAAGQFYPPDPTETSAAIGGTIATNASGSRSFRYGDTRRHVLRLRVVLMDGRILDVRRGDAVDFPVSAIPIPQTTKHTGGYRLSPGMDWIDLFVGSEGTLGVVTEAELRLLPSPAEFLAGVVFFPDDGRAIDAVEAWRGLAPARMLEYFDKGSLDLLRTRFPEMPSAAGAAILFEDETADVDRWHDRLMASGALLDDSWFAATPGDREKFRRFRHALPELVNAEVRRKGFMKLGSDYAVPIARNREMLAEYRRRLEGEFQYVIFGHIGDAHVHVNILPGSQEQYAQGQELMLDFARRAVALGGTVSAEHGLGKRKAHLLELQYTREQIEAMKQVKRRLDPQWLLGRGTLFPI